MKRILDVGNCDPDHSFITGAISSLDAEVVRVHSASEALETVEAQSFDLVIVNRLFDRDGGSGLELISAINQKDAAPATMLISNYEESQKQAQQLGALKGFGKAESGNAVRACIEAALVQSPLAELE